MDIIGVEQVVYLARKLHWSREEIGKLHPVQAIAIYNELAYQESVDEWRRQHCVASILAAIYNTIPRKGGQSLKASDFLSSPEPNRPNEKKVTEVDKRANEAGIALPSK